MVFNKYWDFNFEQAGAELCQAQAPVDLPAKTEQIKKQMLQSTLC